MADFKLMHLTDMPTNPMKGGRGEQVKLINTDCGADKLDVHLNRLDPKEPGGKYYHHTQSDNVYIVKSGEGELVVEGNTYIIREDDVIYIPAGKKHSLTNKREQTFEIFQIYAPAREQFDYVEED